MIKGINPVLTLGGNRVVMPGLPKFHIVDSEDRPTAELALISAYGLSEVGAKKSFFDRLNRYTRVRHYCGKFLDEVKVDNYARGKWEASAECLLIDRSIDRFDFQQGLRAREIYEKLLASGSIRPVR